MAAQGAIGSSLVHGVARGANVVTIQVFSRLASGRATYRDSDVIRGLERVLVLSHSGSLAGRIAAVNMSLGNSDSDYQSEASCDFWNPFWKRAIDNLRSQGIATVIASGNDSKTNGILEPACLSQGGVALGAPNGLRAIASGSNVELRWNAPSVGGDPTGYQIEAGSASGSADLVSFKTGNTTTTYPTSGVGAGTYYIRVKAYNAAGTSDPSNEVPLVVAGPQSPGPPTGLTASSSGSSIQLRWNPPTTGGVTAGYIIEAGSGPGRSDLANFVTGSTATSYAAAGVPNGTYYIRVRATNAVGPSAPTNEAVVSVGTPANVANLAFVQQAELRITDTSGNVLQRFTLSSPDGQFDISEDRSRVIYTTNTNDWDRAIWLFEVESRTSRRLFTAPWSQNLHWLPGSRTVFLYTPASGNQSKIYTYNLANNTSTLWQDTDTAFAVTRRGVYRGGIAWDSTFTKFLVQLGYGGAGGDGIFGGTKCNDGNHNICGLQAVADPGNGSSSATPVAFAPQISTDGRTAYYAQRLNSSSRQIIEKDLVSGLTKVLFTFTGSSDPGALALFGDRELYFVSNTVSGRTVNVCDVNANSCRALFAPSSNVWTLQALRW